MWFSGLSFMRDSIVRNKVQQIQKSDDRKELIITISLFFLALVMLILF